MTSQKLLLSANSGVDEPGVGYKLRRFPLRGPIGIFIPFMVTGLYIGIWSLYLVPADPNNPIHVSPPGALTIFYSWFVISTIGLNISVYGLAGVEASMLMEPDWCASNAMQLVMHCDRTWSSPGGWVNIGRKLLSLWRNKGRASRPVFGKTQGLMLMYNCSWVKNLSDFTILDRFSQRGDNSTGGDSNYKSTTIGNDTVFQRREITGLTKALVEIGISGVEDTNGTYRYYDNANHSTLVYRHGGIGHWDDYYEITELGSFYKTTKWQESEPMKTVGARCISSSSIGTANIDGHSAIFSNFHPSENIPIDGYLISFAPVLFDGKTGVLDLFTSANEADPTDRQAFTKPYCLSGASFSSSLRRLFANAARELATDTNSGSHKDTNLTFSCSNKVLTRGVIPAVAPAVLLGIWAISSMMFSIVYGFRRRWAATLDGYSMFRFGADFGQMVEANKEFSSAEDYDTCGAIRNIAGLVGDARLKFTPGHVTLLSQTWVSCSKLVGSPGGSEYLADQGHRSLDGQCLQSTTKRVPDSLSGTRTANVGTVRRVRHHVAWVKT
ncbi:hypothetical protein K440DRAFT_638170 [Wilcoxina mikolae CBS 423.85]|nr:hypothetical protein K440DRAFT_638170 [Wilcoxina mikolae CBS 423.85]